MPVEHFVLFLIGSVSQLGESIVEESSESSLASEKAVLCVCELQGLNFGASSNGRKRYSLIPNQLVVGEFDVVLPLEVFTFYFDF